MTEEDKMPFGEHKGKKLKDVPEAYYNFLWEHFGPDFKAGSLKQKQKLQKVLEYVEQKRKSKK